MPPRSIRSYLGKYALAEIDVCHFIPIAIMFFSSQALVELAKQGAAYCLVPTLQIEDEIANGELINLCSDKSITLTLYWHSWVLVQGIHKKISKEIVRYGRQILG